MYIGMLRAVNKWHTLDVPCLTILYRVCQTWDLVFINFENTFDKTHLQSPEVAIDTLETVLS